MPQKITIDYSLIIKKDSHKLVILSEKININKSIKLLIDNFFSQYKDDDKIANYKPLIESIKAKDKNFFNIDEKDYAISLNRAWAWVDLPKSNEKAKDARDMFYEYLYANALEKEYEEYDDDKSIIAYSHRIRGIKSFLWKIDDSFKFKISSNFGYGYSSYFDMLLYWKELPIINYLYIIFYRWAGKLSLESVTQVYSCCEESWQECFDDVVFYVNSFYKYGETSFVGKYIENILDTLIKGISFNLNNTLFCCLSSKEIYDLFKEENYFERLYIQPNIILSLDYVDYYELNKIITDNSFEIKNWQKANEVLAKLIKNYENLQGVEKKAKLYFFMLALEKKSKVEGYHFFDQLFPYFSYDNYNGDKDIKQFKDEFDLQMERTEEFELANRAFDALIDTPMEYVRRKNLAEIDSCKNKLLKQNNELIEKYIAQIKQCELDIESLNIELKKEEENLHKKDSYKKEIVFELFFDYMSNYFAKSFSITDLGDISFDDNNECQEQLINVRKEVNNNSFDVANIVNLDSFGFDEEVYIKVSSNQNINFNAKKIRELCKDTANIKERTLLQNFITLMKNIQEIVKLLFTSEYNDLLKSEIVKLMIENVNKIYVVEQDDENKTSINDLMKMIFEKDSQTIIDLVKFYKKVFKLNSRCYINNHLQFNNDAKAFNELKQKIHEKIKQKDLLDDRQKRLVEHNKIIKGEKEND